MYFILLYIYQQPGYYLKPHNGYCTRLVHVYRQSIHSTGNNYRGYWMDLLLSGLPDILIIERWSELILCLLLKMLEIRTERYSERSQNWCTKTVRISESALPERGDDLQRILVTAVSENTSVQCHPLCVYSWLNREVLQISNNYPNTFCVIIVRTLYPIQDKV